TSWQIGYGDPVSAFLVVMHYCCVSHDLLSIEVRAITA
ncbi:MAG: hypothetical protein ACI9GW_001493, partial [Halieaceae bacterium]